MTDNIRVLVVDDHSLFRTGVVQTLALDTSMEIVGEGGSAAEAVELARQQQADVMLLDIAMPGNGIEAAREIARLEHPPKVIMLTVSENETDIMRALEAGAVGYVLKGIKANDLIEAVRSVAAGGSFVSPNLTLRILANVKPREVANPLAGLTKQEERTLRLLAAGLSNREIGQKLGVVEKTIKFHVTRILGKLKVRNRVEAAVIARREWGDDVDDPTAHAKPN